MFAVILGGDHPEEAANLDLGQKKHNHGASNG